MICRKLSVHFLLGSFSTFVFVFIFVFIFVVFIFVVFIFVVFILVVFIFVAAGELTRSIDANILVRWWVLFLKWFTLIFLVDMRRGSKREGGYGPCPCSRPLKVHSSCHSNAAFEQQAEHSRLIELLHAFWEAYLETLILVQQGRRVGKAVFRSLLAGLKFS
jgi:energy-coupling factor transporter transmembrane protein EcfT